MASKSNVTFHLRCLPPCRNTGVIFMLCMYFKVVVTSWWFTQARLRRNFLPERNSSTVNADEICWLQIYLSVDNASLVRSKKVKSTKKAKARLSKKDCIVDVYLYLHNLGRYINEIQLQRLLLNDNVKNNP